MSVVRKMKATLQPILPAPEAHESTAARLVLLLSLVGISVVAAGCAHTTQGATVPPLFQVAVTTVQQRDVPLYSEWIGTLDGLVNADIKAEVSGYLTEQAYVEGSFVKAGQLLFQIDPRPFQAALDQARAQLAQSEGQLAQAQAQLGQAEAKATPQLHVYGVNTLEQALLILKRLGGNVPANPVPA